MGDGQECNLCRKSRGNCTCDESSGVLLLVGKIRQAFREDRKNLEPAKYKAGYIEGWHDCWRELMLTIAILEENERCETSRQEIECIRLLRKAREYCEFGTLDEINEYLARYGS